MNKSDKKDNCEALCEQEKYPINRDKRNDLIVKVMNRIIIGALLIVVFYCLVGLEFVH